LSVVATIAITSCSNGQMRAHANELALGKDATAEAPISVPVNGLGNFNKKTRAEIIQMRTENLMKTPQLLKGEYKPDEGVFSAILDYRPWWGAAGAAVFGAGERSILGPAEESRFVLNPMILVGVNSATAQIWREDKITEEDINNYDFPYFWVPESVEFDAKNARATVVYNVTDYHNRILDTNKLERPVITPKFSLVAYNARDFGYEYIYPDLKASTNITNEHDTGQPVRITQMIHCGGTCGYPGGCNNMSPYTAGIDRMAFTQLPAKLVVYLWKRYPSSVQQTPDFTMTIDLR
jgi:hypothetical protein